MSYSSDRRFQIWDYRVSHRQLLLRSPRSPEVETNVDIHFWGVEFVGIPAMLEGLELQPASRALASSTEQLTGKRREGVEVFEVKTQGRSGVVVAAGYKVVENELDIFDSSLVDFGKAEMDRQPGRVLVHS